VRLFLIHRFGPLFTPMPYRKSVIGTTVTCPSVVPNGIVCGMLKKTFLLDRNVN
jgi:hypothetical protein